MNKKLASLFKDFCFKVFDYPLFSIMSIRRKLGKKSYFSANSSISDSDSTKYTRFVEQSNLDKDLFASFRRNFHYRQILEHVSYSLGHEYLQQLTDNTKNILMNSSKIRALNKIGKPRTFGFEQIGEYSPTLLRYAAVAENLNKIFGKQLGEAIVEIGIGFGGQYAVLSETNKFNSYTFFDLDPVVRLSKKVIRDAGFNLDRIFVGNIEDPSISECSLVISNYAFSELPREIQLQYIKGVFSKATRGYLTMNSGRTDFTGRSQGKLSLEELKELLPPFSILEESPITGPDNYLIVWGD